MVVFAGAIVFFPRTPVDRATSGSPIGTLALSSQQNKVQESPSFTAKLRRYLNKAKLKWSSGEQVVTDGFESCTVLAASK